MTPTKKKTFLFGRKNYYILLVSLLFIIIGYILMAGGGSKDPTIFNDEIFNFRRIRLAPTLVLIGFGIAIFAILHSPKNQKK